MEPSLNQSIILLPHKPIRGKGNFRFTTGFISDLRLLDAKSTSAYTYGLKPLWQDEMEVLNTQAPKSFTVISSRN